jgi:hypothetical protein
MKGKHLGTMVFLGILGIFILGCSSIVTTSEFSGQMLTETGDEPVAHIHSDIWGIYFLGFQSCPVITGSYKEPGSYHFFRDTVDTNTAAGMVTEKSKEMGATAVIDLETDWDSSWQTFTLIFWLKEAQASGNAVILAGEEDEEEIEVEVTEETP